MFYLTFSNFLHLVYNLFYRFSISSTYIEYIKISFIFINIIFCLIFFIFFYLIICI